MTNRERAEAVIDSFPEQYEDCVDLIERALGEATTEEREEIRSLITTLRESAGDDGGDDSAKAACTYVRGTCDTIDAAIRARGGK